MCKGMHTHEQMHMHVHVRVLSQTLDMVCHLNPRVQCDCSLCVSTDSHIIGH